MIKVVNNLQLLPCRPATPGPNWTRSGPSKCRSLRTEGGRIYNFTALGHHLHLQFWDWFTPGPRLDVADSSSPMSSNHPDSPTRDFGTKCPITELWLSLCLNGTHAQNGRTLTRPLCHLDQPPVEMYLSVSFSPGWTALITCSECQHDRPAGRHGHLVVVVVVYNEQGVHYW